jgi:hypothetical protein
MAEAPFPHGSPPWTFLRPPCPPLCCFVVLVMLSFIVGFDVESIELSVLLGDLIEVSPEVAELAELSLDELFAQADAIFDSQLYS